MRLRSISFPNLIMKTQFGKRILESKVCVLCGEREATTKEHVPPQALFTTKPRDYLLVPACGHCNHSTKLDDEYFLHVLSGGSLVGEGHEVWKQKVKPQLDQRPKTRAGLRNQLSIQNLAINANENMIMPVLQIDGDRIKKSAGKLVHGLFWWHTGSILGAPAEMIIQWFNVVDGNKVMNDPVNKPYFDQTVLGIYQDPEVQKTFFYTWAVSEEAALFYFFFYKQNMIVSWINRTSP